MGQGPGRMQGHGATSGQGGSPARLKQRPHTFASALKPARLALGGTAWASCSEGSLLLGLGHRVPARASAPLR